MTEFLRIMKKNKNNHVPYILEKIVKELCSKSNIHYSKYKSNKKSQFNYVINSSNLEQSMKYYKFLLSNDNKSNDDFNLDDTFTIETLGAMMFGSQFKKRFNMNDTTKLISLLSHNLDVHEINSDYLNAQLKESLHRYKSTLYNKLFNKYISSKENIIKYSITNDEIKKYMSDPSNQERYNKLLLINKTLTKEDFVYNNIRMMYMFKNINDAIINSLDDIQINWDTINDKEKEIINIICNKTNISKTDLTFCENFSKSEDKKQFMKNEKEKGLIIPAQTTISTYIEIMNFANLLVKTASTFDIDFPSIFLIIKKDIDDYNSFIANIENKYPDTIVGFINRYITILYEFCHDEIEETIKNAQTTGETVYCKVRLRNVPCADIELNPKVLAHIVYCLYNKYWPGTFKNPSFVSSKRTTKITEVTPEYIAENIPINQFINHNYSLTNYKLYHNLGRQILVFYNGKENLEDSKLLYELCKKENIYYFTAGLITVLNLLRDININKTKTNHLRVNFEFSD